MIPKRLPQSDFEIRQELHPAATRKIGGNKNETKIVDGNLIKFISNDLEAHLSKPFSQFF